MLFIYLYNNKYNYSYLYMYTIYRTIEDTAKQNF